MLQKTMGVLPGLLPLFSAARVEYLVSLIPNELAISESLPGCTTESYSSVNCASEFSWVFVLLMPFMQARALAASK